MPSFDVVSKVDKQEVDNAFQQTKKELAQRYDFKGTDTTIEHNEEGIVLRSSTEDRIKAAYEVLIERGIKRKISPRVFDPQKIETAGGSTFRQTVKLKEGISTEKGREIVKLIKDQKIKVQAQIMDDQVRVSGKNRDDLQAVIRLLRERDLDIELQFVNMRD
jgi:cyclic-di-GMP-binding protein